MCKHVNTSSIFGTSWRFSSEPARTQPEKKKFSLTPSFLAMDLRTWVMPEYLIVVCNLKKKTAAGAGRCGAVRGERAGHGVTL